VTVTATITNGLTASSPYTKDFTVTVNDGFVPVNNISGVPGTAVVGTLRTLTGTVEPANATNQTIVWTVTGAAIVDGNKLQTTAVGTVKVTALITNGLTASSPYTQDFDITVSLTESAFVAVSNIGGVPGTAAAGTLLTLTGTVEPSDATNQTIVWTVKSQGTTGAAIVDGNKLQTTAGGTVTVTAAITNGLTVSSSYVRDFDITVSPASSAFVAVSAIGGIPAEAIAGALTLTGTVEPSDATNQTIVWTVKSQGTTGATIAGNTLTTTAAGTVTVTATITNGLTASSPYTQDFPVEIKAPQLTISSYTVHSYNTVRDINFSDVSIGGYTLTSLPEYANSPAGNTNQGAVLNKWFDWLQQMQVQGDNLKNGYSAVESAYPSLPGLSNIISNENGGANSIHNKIDNTQDAGTYLSSADANINSILDGIFTDRVQFDKYLAAYKAGHYYNTKVRNDGGSKDEAYTAFTQALSATGLQSLEAVEAAMLSAINVAMGVGNITNTNHRDKISGLNSDLIKQIQDLSQAGAVANDFSGLSFNSFFPIGTILEMQNILGEGNLYNEPGDAQTVPSVSLQNSAAKAVHFLAGSAGAPGTVFA
jgi:hypothetical protein